MTPKEKAKELFDRLAPFTDIDENAKYCALIAVDEVIASLKSIFGQDEDKQPDIIYWDEVKEEIGKL